LLGLLGLAVIVVSGAVKSIVHVKLAGVPTFPIASVPRTANVWLPAASPVYEVGLVHAAKALPSS
jgi:hypothetical protein